MYELVPPTRVQLDLRHVRLRGIRQFMAAAFGQSGTPAATISARLGYRDRATALKTRSHAIPAADADSANFIGSVLGGPATGRGAR